MIYMRKAVRFVPKQGHPSLASTQRAGPSTHNCKMGYFIDHEAPLRGESLLPGWSRMSDQNVNYGLSERIECEKSKFV